MGWRVSEHQVGQLETRYTDEYTGEMLRDDLVQAAMFDEIDYSNKTCLGD